MPDRRYEPPSPPHQQVRDTVSEGHKEKQKPVPESEAPKGRSSVIERQMEAPATASVCPICYSLIAHEEEHLIWHGKEKK